MALKVTGEELADMMDHARTEYPRECVGALIGDGIDSSKNRLIRLSNVQDKMHIDDPERFNRDATTGYFVDPKEVFDLVRRVEREGLKIVAFYHSHPDHECFFSQEDHNAAVMWDEPVYPGVDYIVISVMKGEVKDAVVFSWDGARYSFSEKLPI